MDDYSRYKKALAWVRKQPNVKETGATLGPQHREFEGDGVRYRVLSHGDVEVTKIIRNEDLELPN